MTVERALRGLAGGFVLLSLALGWFVHAGFYLFTAFVGLNLLQSGFTNWCPAMWAFRRMGLRDGGREAGQSCCDEDVVRPRA
jgi:hypothetical protein